MTSFKINPELGLPSMKQRQGDFPVFYCYALDKEGSYNIIGSNTYNSSHPWVLKKARVSITRFWDASTFYLTFQASIPNWDSPIPPLPEVDGKPLQAEDDIVIVAGYTQEVNDLISIKDTDTIFVGSIDILNIVGSERGGVTFTIQGRDRMKWLMDSTISYNAISDSNKPGPRVITNDNLRSGKEEGIVPRSDIILEVAQRGLGYVPERDTKVKRGIVEGQVYDVSKSNENKVDTPDWHYTSAVGESHNLSNVNRTGERINANEGSTLNFGGSPSKHITFKNPFFNIYVTRPGFSAVDEAIGGIGIQIVDQTPIDYIKFLAQQEVYPTNLFQDHKNGNLYYTPRLNDLSGLTGSKERLYRTYYYRPESLYAQSILEEDDIVDLRQQIFTLKEERTSLSVRTNYIVGNASAGSGRNEVMINFKALPASWEGKDYPSRYMQINDENIDTSFEAAAVAAAKARIFSRDTRSGMMIIQGDPTLSPGECVQIKGSLLTQTYTKGDYEKDLVRFKGAQQVLKKSIVELQDKVKDGRLEEQNKRSEGSNSNVNEKAKEKVQNSAGNNFSPVGINFASVGNSEESTNSTNLENNIRESVASALESDQDFAVDDFNHDNLLDEEEQETYTNLLEGPYSGKGDFYSASDPESIYRIEAINHKLNDGREGYVTEVSLLSPF